MQHLRIFKFALLLLMLNGINAQTKLVVGKKLNITQETALTNTSNMMGSNMTTSINDTVNFVVEVKSIIDSTMKVTCTLKRVKGLISMMGQEQIFDSDDASTTSNPMIANFLKDMNKEQDFVLINGKFKTGTNKKSDIPEELAANGIVASNEALVADLFVPTTIIGKSKGYQWTDEQASDDGNNKSITIFSIVEANPSSIEISSNTSISSKGNNKMMGYDVKQNLTGTRTSTQNFNVLSGILSSSTQTITMTGTAEVMSMNFPINSKLQTKTIVE